MQSLFFFVIALAILIAIHEFGHFWVARRCGVKVLKFSIGFGKPIWQKTASNGTQYILAAIPLGGYVKMLDEREGDVPVEQLDQAFNRQSLGKRTAIVAAGPIANLLFAIVAYWLVFISGIPGIKPIVDEVEVGSPAAFAQLMPGDQINKINGELTPTWSSVNQAFMTIAEQGGTAELSVLTQDIEHLRRIEITKQSLLTDEPKSIIKQLGLVPMLYDLKPVIGQVIPQQAAELAGLQTGDIILLTDGQKIDSWRAWVEVIKASPETELTIALNRDNRLTTLTLKPNRSEEGHGFIGAGVDATATAMPDALKSELRYGPLEGIVKAVNMTWQMSSLTIRSFIAMLKGELSSKNLGGPISIAQFAGASADKGITAFISFLAIISISLGILNLLPIPILDGGHLMLYFFEWLRGKPISETVQLQGQKIGLILLLTLMFFAFFNDLSRLFGL
ncbi:MAG: RIP metalloprotease RseP [Piscirickettsiaceae bacterium]|jgi:regulator of sigma E protease|nr:RIP metalloprotease RseP [Piscirickettsiaceae bacterium]